jgi:CRISPR-associated protein Csm2
VKSLRRDGKYNPNWRNPYGGGKGHHSQNDNCDRNSFEAALKKKPIDVVQLRDVMKECRNARVFKGVSSRFFNEAANQVRERFFEASPQDRLDWAVIVATHLKILDLKTNQVRKILDLVRDIHLEFQGEDVRPERISSKLMRMRFILAYSVGKAEKDAEALDALHRVLEPLAVKLSASPKKEDFGKFYDFVEAIIAYHKFFGGSEK